MPVPRARRHALCLLALASPAAAHAADAVAVKPKMQVQLCLDVAGKSRAAGATVQLWQCSTNDNQRWTWDGQALKVYGSACLDVTDGHNEDGAGLQIWPCTAPNDNQRFERFGDLLRWVGTDKCLDVTDGRAQNGTAMQLWTCDGSNPHQRFAFVDAGAQAALAAVGSAVAQVAAAATKSANVASTKLQSAGTYLGFPYISLASFLNKHPVLKPLRQAIIDAGNSVTPALPPVLLAAVAMEESSGNPQVPGGLMQFTWAPTWAAYGQGDINNGRDSLFAAARYLTALLQENDNDLAASLRAYNGDANRNYVAEIKAWMTGGFPYGEGT